MKRYERYGCGCGVVLFLLLLLGPILVIEVPGLLFFGWINFLIQTIPKMTIEPAAFAVAGAALAAAVPLTHWLARWLWGAKRSEGEASARPWRFRWTASILFLVVFSFVAGIGLIGTVHEVAWLFARHNEPFITGGAREIPRRLVSLNNLKQIGLGMWNYHDKYQRFAPGGTFDRYGQGLHSWETAILPYVEQMPLYEKIHLDLPWDHPANKQHFEKQLSVFLNPSMTRRGEKSKDARGYALSHYALNSHMARPNVGVSIKEVTDGTAKTIMAGEANGNFKPWGDPVNWRDPSLGINGSPDGFGGHPGGALFLFVDGSVRFLSETTDPAVLKALATPAGGESLKESDYEP